MNDQKTIELIRNGRADISLNKLYRHSPMVKKMILSKGGNANDARKIFSRRR